MPLSRVTIDGISTACQIDGVENGPVVLFSNSLGTDMSMWDSQVQALRDRFCILRYDTRGHGSTDEPDGPFGIEDLARDALAVADHFQKMRFHFVGLSLGGMVGQVLGSLHGDRLSSLTLCATASEMNPSVWTDRIQQIESGGLDSVVTPTLERWFTDDFRASSAEIVAGFGKSLVQTSTAGYIRCAAAIRGMNLVPLLSNIAVPTLVVSGMDDVSTPPSAGRAIANAVKGAQLVILEKAAHLLAVEQAERFNEVLKQFLEVQESQSLASHTSSGVTA